jgi:hypothetical protein
MNRTGNKLLPTGQPHERRHPLEDGGVKITTFVPLQFRKRGIKKVVVAPVGIENSVVVKVAEAAITQNQDPTLLKVLGRGFYWQHLLDTGTVADAAEIAEREGMHRVTINDGLRFALLAPGIVQAALEGTLSRTMSLEMLQRRSVPLDWVEQRGMVDELG